jgi:hypothetical protein
VRSNSVCIFGKQYLSVSRPVSRGLSEKMNSYFPMERQQSILMLTLAMLIGSELVPPSD